MKSQSLNWSERVLLLVRKLNNFHLPDSSKSKCHPFFIQDQRVGNIRPDIWDHLQEYKHIFHLQGNEVHLAEDLNTFDKRTTAVDTVLRDLRKRDVFTQLKGWREEHYDVKKYFHDPPLMEMERSATCLFGIKRYGIHINGYCYTPDRGLCVWIAKRSATKQTDPNKLDNLASGGLTSGLQLLQCARKEAQEEANVPNNILESLKPVGAVSYTYEDERGIRADGEFCFDLEVPTDFVPENTDGEVQSFRLLTVDEVKEAIVAEDFKWNSALVILEFFIRHGILTGDNERYYFHIIEMMHTPLT